MASASPLAIVGGNSVSAGWLIERKTDIDYFMFTAGSGTVNLSISPFYCSPNLDVIATLYNAKGTAIATSNPADALIANISISVAGGSYYLAIDGTGKTPLNTGYIDYGSLGHYSISGSIVPVPVQHAEVLGRHVFYNQSYFDGYGAAAAIADDNAIDSAKTALLPGGMVSFSNYTSYWRGINGIMLDFQGLAGAVTTSDFRLKVGNSSDPSM